MYYPNEAAHNTWIYGVCKFNYCLFLLFFFDALTINVTRLTLCILPKACVFALLNNDISRENTLRNINIH